MNSRLNNLYQKALEKNDLKLMRRLYNENPGEYSITIDYARMLIKVQKYSEAEKVLLDSFASYGNTLIALEYAKLKYLLGEIDFAIKCLKSLLNSDKALDAMYELGRLELDRGNYKEAREYLEKVYSVKNNFYILSQLGKLEYLVGNYFKARKYQKAALELAKSGYAKFELAKTEFKLKNYVEAKKLFLELAEEQPDNNTHKAFLGKIEFIEGNYDKAKEYLYSVYLAEKSDMSILELGRLESKNGNYSEARKYFEQILDSKFQIAVLFEMGVLEYNHGNLLKAKEYLDKIDLNTKYLNYSQIVDVVKILAKVEFIEGNYDKSKEHNQWLLDHGINENNRRHIAKIEILNNNYAEARAVLEQRTEDDILSTIELGRLEVLEGNLDKAKNIFEGLLSTYLKYWALFELARVEFQNGNVDIAKKYFLECLHSGEKDSYVLLELARLEYFEGNVDKSEQYLKEIIDNKHHNYLYAVQNIIILYIHQEKYLEAFDYIKYLEDNDFDIDPKTKLALMKKLNIYFKNNNIQMNYNNNQTVDYDEYLAIEHVLERHKDDFSSDVDIYALFNEIKDLLNEDNKVLSLQVNDMYNIPYPNISSNSNTLRVITLPNSKQILTMFPVEDNKKYDCDEQGNELTLVK